jgi:hypothetical protein
MLNLLFGFRSCTVLIGSVCFNRFLEVGPRAVLTVNFPQKAVPRFPVVRHLARARPKETAVGGSGVGHGSVRRVIAVPRCRQQRLCLCLPCLWQALSCDGRQLVVRRVLSTLGDGRL